MQPAPVIDCDAGPIALAVALSTLIQHAPAAVTAQALELIRPRLGEGDWTRLMAAIAPLPPRGMPG
jgi:hypothetical protein